MLSGQTFFTNIFKNLFYSPIFRRIELEQHLVENYLMFFGVSKKKLIGWGLLATGVKVAFGFWLFGQLGWHLPSLIEFG